MSRWIRRTLDRRAVIGSYQESNATLMSVGEHFGCSGMTIQRIIKRWQPDLLAAKRGGVRPGGCCIRKSDR